MLIIPLQQNYFNNFISLFLISNNYLKVSTDESDQDKYALAECEVQELDKENKNGRIYSSESVEVDDDGFSII